MTISKDRVKPSPLPDSWKLAEIFATGIVLGGYLAMMTVIFFYAAYKTNFFPVSPFSCTFSSKYTMFLMSIISKKNRLIIWQRVFGVATLEKTAHDDFRKLASAIYLQVSTISQALIFVTRSRSWSFMERPGLLLVAAFAVAQLVSNFVIF